MRYGDRPDVRARLNEVVDAAVGANLQEALRERALVSDVLTSADIEAIRERMEQAEARRLQPHFVRAFFIEAFRSLGGSIVRREPGRYEITHVPADIRAREHEFGRGEPILRRYERVTFDKPFVAPLGEPVAQLLSPGHPLLDATVELVLERHREQLRKGAILVDESDPGETPRALLYVEDAIQSAKIEAGGSRRVVSKRLQFVEIDAEGESRVAGYAPYLDYRALDPGEPDVLRPLLDQEWLRGGIEQAGLDYAINVAIPEHLEEVRRLTVSRVQKTMAAVKERLTREITYWDRRAEELKAQELAGKKPKLNSGRARQRADDLEVRKKRRMQDLEQEMQLSPLPPVVIGGALVVPAGYLDRLIGDREQPVDEVARETERIERVAVDAVLAIERELGREPQEMPRNNPGYDILSKDPVTGEILFIEVKGRARGAETVTITKTEILTSLNKPEQFVLALVEVEENDEGTVSYLREPFAGPEEALFGVTSVNFSLKELRQRATPATDLAPSVAKWLPTIIERLVKDFEPLKVIVFGSRARREARPDSDLDLLVVFGKVENRREAAVSIRRALADLPISKDVFVAAADELEVDGGPLPSLVETARDEGRVVYARG